MAGRDGGVGGYDWLTDLQKRNAASLEIEGQPETLTLAQLAKKCDRDERVLRLQYRGEGHEYAAGGKGRLPEFPDAWELGLQRPGRTTATKTAPESATEQETEVDTELRAELLKYP